MKEPITRAGFTVTWHEDDYFVYHFADGTRETIDAWFEVSHAHDVEFAQSGQHLARIILFASLILPSPYAITRATRLSNQTPPNLRESSAFVVENELAYTLVSALVSNLQEKKVRDSTRIFRSESEAAAWLRNRIASQ
jgi:hypothetical protein